MIEQYTSPVAVNNSQEPWLVGEGVVVSGGVAIPSLDFNFITGGLPGTVTFTRASTATYFNSAGVLTSAAINEARFDYNPSTLAAQGLLIEEQRTNLLLNSDTLSTQSVTVSAIAYTLSFYGTGTVTLSGVSTAGPLVGSGAFPTRSTLTFTPTAGTLTLTVTGTVQYAQLEAGAFPTSYIPTTTTSLTRSADVTTINTLSPWFNATEGTFYIEATALWTLPPSAVILTVNNDTLASQLRLFLRAASSPTNNRLSLYYATVAVLGNMPTVPAENSTSKMAFNYNDPADTAEGTRDGLATTSGAWTGTLSAASVVDIGQGYNNANQLCGWIRRITYYPRALSSAELQSITT